MDYSQLMNFIRSIVKLGMAHFSRSCQIGENDEIRIQYTIYRILFIDYADGGD